VDGEGDPSTTEPADESSEQAIARIREVRNRAEKWFEWRGEDDSMFDTGLAHLMLGRTYLAEAELQTEPTAPGADVDGESDETANSELSAFGSLRQAEQHLNQSVSLLRQSGTQHHLPRGLLHLAALWREAILASGRREPTDDSTFDSPSTDRKKNQGTDVRRSPEELLSLAERDLSEAESIAERGSMLIFQIEAALERARLFLTLHQAGWEGEAPAEPSRRLMGTITKAARREPRPPTIRNPAHRGLSRLSRNSVKPKT